MKIINKTEWRTDQWRKLIMEVCRRELVDPKPYTVWIKHRRHRRRLPDDCPGGSAWYNSHRFSITIARHAEVLDSAAATKVIAHELAHTQGVRHRAMKGSSYGWAEGWRDKYAWAKCFPLEKKAGKIPEPKGRLTVLQNRTEHARRMMRRWRSKEKRARTMLRKYGRKVKYYERKMAAMRDQPAKVR